MKKFFTISEFAHLRNVNINSLRYYEKIGLLKPARIDPDTKYRYYSAEQLAQLDTVLLCVTLQIPLKNLKNYVDENGVLQNQRLLEDGKAASEKKIREIESGLNKIEYFLRYLDETKAYNNIDGFYIRQIAARQIVTIEYTGDLSDAGSVEQRYSKLFSSAQQRGLSPIFPSGIMIKYEEQKTKYFLFFEIADTIKDSPDVITVPAGDFRCIQFDGNAGGELLPFIEEHCTDTVPKTIFVSNMLLDRFQIGSRRCEIQIPAECS
ncbi:MAG: MerR family transcriptional regulator [Clostridia bacterium]|nr:MerR family transcriptional regulator [Clostridia bacterium]